MATKDDSSEETYEKTLCVIPNPKPTKLTQEGYSNVFVDNIRDLGLDIECPFCCLVVRDARQISTCGHTFCRSCWKDWCSGHDSDDAIVCPVDKESVQLCEVFVDRKTDRYILSLKVYCDNRDFGCDATPELRYLEAHLDKCGYQTVSCELMCGRRILLNLLQDHMERECERRMVDCETCGLWVQFQHLVAHGDVCEMKLMTCDYCDTAGILRHEMEDHEKSKCTKFPTFCSYAMIGCREKIERDALPAHHETASNHHLQLLHTAVHHLYDVTGAVPAVDKYQYELPAPMWGRVSDSGSDGNVPWGELPGFVGEERAQRDGTLVEQVARLKKSYGKSQNTIRDLKREIVALKVDVGDRNFQQMEWKMESDNTRKLMENEIRDLNGQFKNRALALINTNEKFMKHVTKIEEESANKMYDIKRRYELLENKCREQSKDNERLAASCAEMMAKIDQLSFSVVKKTNFTGELVDGTYNMCPCSWSFALDDKHKESPAFYTEEGYRLRFVITVENEEDPYRYNRKFWRIKAVLVKGKNDATLKWPYVSKMKMQISKDGKVANSNIVATPPGQPGTSRPTDEVDQFGVIGGIVNPGVYAAHPGQNPPTVTVTMQQARN